MGLVAHRMKSWLIGFVKGAMGKRDTKLSFSSVESQKICSLHPCSSMHQLFPTLPTCPPLDQQTVATAAKAKRKGQLNMGSRPANECRPQALPGEEQGESAKKERCGVLPLLLAPLSVRMLSYQRSDVPFAVFMIRRS